jgi:flagellar biosynthetic protein FliO
MKSIIETINRWYQSVPPSKRWAVWAFTGLIVIFSVALVIVGSMTGTDLASDSGAENASMAFDVVIKLVVVLLLIYVSASVYKKWNQRSAQAPQRILKVHETARLSNKQALHVVQIGEETFLIGATDQNITLIAAVQSSDPAAMPTETGASASFLSMLRNQSGAQLQKRILLQNNGMPGGQEK